MWRCFQRQSVAGDEARCAAAPAAAAAAATKQQSATTKAAGSSGDGAMAQVLVECSSEGGTSSASAGSGGGGGASMAAEDDTFWHDACEHWQPEAEDEGDQQQQQQTQQQQAQPATTHQLLAALPPPLASVLSGYLAGKSAGCKPAVGVLMWMVRSNTSVDQLRALLAPLMLQQQPDAEAAPPLPPTLSPCLMADELTAQLRAAAHQHQQQQQQHAQEPQAQEGSGGDDLPSLLLLLPPLRRHQLLEHLLGNVILARDTLALIREAPRRWRLVADGPLQLWYHHDTQAGRQMIQAQCVLNEPLSTLATLTREVDLVPGWNPTMTVMRELASYSATELLVFLLLWMPWPLPQPVLCNYSVGLDLLDLQPQQDDGPGGACVLVAMQSRPAPAGVELPQHPRTIPLELSAGGFQMVPLPPAPDGTPRTQMTVMTALDSRYSLPAPVISALLKVVAPLIYRSVCRVLQRMFHEPVPAASSTAAGATPSVVGSTSLRERLGLRPECVALDARAERFLARQQQQQ